MLALLEPWVRDGGDPIVVRTSGSTGSAKDVVLSHAAVMASAHAALDRLGGPGQWLSAIPATGVGGLQVLVRSIVAGIEPVFADEHADLRVGDRGDDGRAALRLAGADPAPPPRRRPLGCSPASTPC